MFNLSAVLAEEKILVFGDSLSAGYGMSPSESWVALLEQTLTNDYPQYEVVNASVSGETTVGGLKRLAAVLDHHRPKMVLIELGGNDGLRGYPITRIRRNLQKMIDLAAARQTQIVLIPITLPPNYGRRYIEAIENMYQDLAQSNGLALTPNFLLEFADRPDLMQADGIHPSAAAQPIIFRTIWPTLLSLIASG